MAVIKTGRTLRGFGSDHSRPFAIFRDLSRPFATFRDLLRYFATFRDLSGFISLGWRIKEYWASDVETQSILVSCFMRHPFFR